MNSLKVPVNTWPEHPAGEKKKAIFGRYAASVRTYSFKG
jgi:hypothetical protein